MHKQSDSLSKMEEALLTKEIELRKEIDKESKKTEKVIYASLLVFGIAITVLIGGYYYFDSKKKVSKITDNAEEKEPQRSSWFKPILAFFAEQIIAAFMKSSIATPADKEEKRTTT